MDSEVLDMIDQLADEILAMEDPDWETYLDKKKLVDLLESRIIWVINYTHNVDAIL